MKLLIQVVAILLLVNSCGKESNEPAPLEQTQQVEQAGQAEQKEPEKQASRSRPEETPYQRAIRAKIKGSNKDKDSKDKDSNDDKDG